MQDILLEPFGGQVFGMSVGQTTFLTALLAFGTLAGFAISAHLLSAGRDPYRVAATGIITGILAFAGVIFSPALESVNLFRFASTLIGFGGGLFAVGMLTAAMELASTETSGLALGAWGAVQATAGGLAIAASGLLRDLVSGLAMNGQFGITLQQDAIGYSFVYHMEIALLFATLIALGPLVRVLGHSNNQMPSRKFGLAHYPG
jgi:MFS transporter, BCD family, chlorophyll transporter